MPVMLLCARDSYLIHVYLCAELLPSGGQGGQGGQGGSVTVCLGSKCWTAEVSA